MPDDVPIVKTAGGTVVGGLGGRAAGMAAGAALGSVVPVIGTAIGGMVGGAVAPALAADGPTLTAVKKRGELICVVHQGRYGFAIADKKG